jgi:hypothetical protein
MRTIIVVIRTGFNWKNYVVERDEEFLSKLYSNAITISNFKWKF